MEDDDSIRALVARILDCEGIQALSAASGAAAVQILKDDPRPLALAIVDIRLPDMDGWAVLQFCKERRPAAGLLRLTGDPLTGPPAEFADLCAVPTIAKPFTLDEFAATVRALIRAAGAREARLPDSPHRI